MEETRKRGPLNRGSPTKKTLMDVIIDFERLNNSILCCRNCYEASFDVLACWACGTQRCWSCCHIQTLLRQKLAPYLVLEFGLQPSSIDKLMTVFRVKVKKCVGCGIQACSMCDDIRPPDICAPPNDVRFLQVKCKECRGVTPS